MKITTKAYTVFLAGLLALQYAPLLSQVRAEGQQVSPSPKPSQMPEANPSNAAGAVQNKNAAVDLAKKNLSPAPSATVSPSPNPLPSASALPTSFANIPTAETSIIQQTASYQGKAATSEQVKTSEENSGQIKDEKILKPPLPKPVPSLSPSPTPSGSDRNRPPDKITNFDPPPKTLSQLLWSLYGITVSKLYGVSTEEDTLKRIEASIENALAEARNTFNNPNLKWSDIEKMARDKGFVDDPKTAMALLGPGQVLKHESSYDIPGLYTDTFSIPGKAFYSIMTESDVLAKENKSRANGWYNTVTNVDQIKNDLLNGEIIGVPLFNTVNRNGDTTINDLMNLAASYKTQNMSSQDKRRALYAAIHSKFSDNQTMQGSHDYAVLQRTGEAVCRDLAGLIFNAYNLAGIPATFHANNDHAWVETTNDSGQPIVIDANFVYNYMEIPGSRGGAYVDYQGNMYLPNGKQIEKGSVLRRYEWDPSNTGLP